MNEQKFSIPELRENIRALSKETKSFCGPFRDLNARRLKGIHLSVGRELARIEAADPSIHRTALYSVP
jgi:hypothetical protein